MTGSVGTVVNAAMQLCRAALVVVAMLNSPAVQAQSEVESNNTQSTTVRVQKFVQDVAAFQALAIKDYEQALTRYGGGKAVERFRALDAVLWAEVSPATGWGYFFNVSIRAFGGVEGGRPLAAFYNPWCDLYLVTVWDQQESGARVVDAEILMGDLVRRGGRPPFGYDPLWVRPEIFKPAAVGLAVVDSVTAFEELYPRAGVRNWRSRLVAESGPYWEDNLEGARLLLLRNLNNIAQLVRPETGEDPTLTTLRTLAEIVVILGVRGRIEEVLAVADETIPQVARALRYMAPETFEYLRPVAYYLAGGGGYVFLAPQAQPGLFVSLMIKRQDDRSGEIKRIDIVPYAGIYETVAREGLGSSRGGGQ